MSRLKRALAAVEALAEEVEDLAVKKPKPRAKAKTLPSANPAAAKLAAAARKPAAPAVVRRVSGANRRAADRAGYDARELAVRYPEVVPPVPAIDPKSGREFMAKQLSPEAEALSVARKRAQKEIEGGEYSPFFDTTKRFYADPEPYALQGNTLIDAMPKRADTIAKYEGIASTPEAIGRLEDAYRSGLNHPSAADWYAMGQLERSFIDQYGPEVGRALFKERFADAMAATTGGADPTSNLLMAAYGNTVKAAGDEVPRASYDLPFPIGGRYAANNVAMFDKIIGRGAGLTTDNPKRFNFSANFLGDTKRATIDEQMSNLFSAGMQIPPGDSYGVFERVLGDLAAKQGVDPANFQDVAWAGGKLAKTPKFKPKPMIEIVNEAIERTARVTGQDPEDVVADAVVKAEKPLYAKGGAVRAKGFSVRRAAA